MTAKSNDFKSPFYRTFVFGSRPSNAYQRFGPLNLIFSLIHVAHPCPNFYRGKSAKSGSTFDLHSPVSRHDFEMEQSIWNPKQPLRARWWFRVFSKYVTVWPTLRHTPDIRPAFGVRLKSDGRGKFAKLSTTQLLLPDCVDIWYVGALWVHGGRKLWKSISGQIKDGGRPPFSTY